MIGEARAFNSTIQTERLFRQNSGETTVRPSEQQNVSQQDSGTDSVALSAEAIALSRNVAPASETTEILATSDSTNQSIAQEDQQTAGRIDLKV